jgi:hypothetical protein
VPLDIFYEKVVKVKADVAAILKFFLLIPPDRGRPSRRGPAGAHRGDAQGGVQRSGLKPPLAGGAAALMCASAFCWRTQRASGVGGTRPPRLSPAGGNGKGGVQTSLLPQAVRAGVVRMPGTPLVYCVLALLPRFSPFRSPTYMSIRSFRFPEVLLRHPLLCRASIRTLNGPHWARCKLGSDLKPGPSPQ